MAYSEATQAKIDKFRRWIVDYAPQNIVTLAQESDDDYIYDQFTDAIDNANNVIAAAINPQWTLDTFPSFGILKYGTLLGILAGQGIFSARNAVDYSDTGGLNVRAFNTWERYLQWLNYIRSEWMQGVIDMKRAYNISRGYGGISSDYSRFF